VYDLLNAVSQFFYNPLTSLAYGTRHIPLLSAFILGLLGAISPCQLTGNIGMITYYGNHSLQKRIPWSEVIFYLLGKIVVFTGLGLVVWMFGEGLSLELRGAFQGFRKLLGPVFVLMGLYLTGVLKLKWTFSFGTVFRRKNMHGKMGAFLLGSSFSLGFCPTMFLLFFGLLIPMVLSTPYGAVLPSIFALGTALPFLFVVFLISYFELTGWLLKRGKKIGYRIQQTAGIFLVMIGILDTFTYWS
jgi:cytochrome c-type biogenesis protein